MILRTLLVLGLVGGSIVSSSSAETVQIKGGQTSVILATDLLASQAGLLYSGSSDDAIVPGTIPNSVGFPINSRDTTLPAFPTTFEYDPEQPLVTPSGVLAHEGSLFFNSDSIEVGNFTIGYDTSRFGLLGGLASGYFVESNTGVEAILFDIENPSQLDATTNDFTLESNLLVSPEFATLLLANGLTLVDLTGVDVGNTLVEAVVPEPGTLSLGVFGALLGLLLAGARHQLPSARGA